MGILRETAAMVRALPLPAGFSVCELGDQQMAGKVATPAEAFYRELGCGRYVSIDGNGQGTVTADLNRPVTALNLGTFDLVTDFGTGEHIFDQAQVWRTLHELTKPGGYIAFDRPSRGYEQHCFYSTHLCLYEDIAAANGYAILQMDTRQTPRGALILGVYWKSLSASPFRHPQQGRYRAVLFPPSKGAA